LNNSASAGTARYDDTFLAVNSLVIIHGSSSGSRVAIDGSGIYGYNGSNVRFVLKTDGSGWLGASASLYWSSAGVVGINGNVLVNGSVVIGKFGTDATDRMFDTSGASNNIQAWQATANATYINGDYIYTNTIQLGALNGSITDRLFNSSGNSDVVQTWITGADIKGTYIQGGSIAVVSLSPAVTDRMFTSSGNSDRHG